MVKRLVLSWIERHSGPMVFDADALNVLASLEPFTRRSGGTGEYCDDAAHGGVKQRDWCRRR